MNYYEILKVSKNATPKQIRTSYKNLIKKYHPDIYKGDKTFAEKITKELNDAYDTLSVPKKRAEYDLSLAPPPTTQNNSYKSYYNYRQNYRATNTEAPKQTWDQKLKKKIYEYVDNHTKNLNNKSKIILVILIIFIALLFTLISILDYIKLMNISKI